MVGATARWITAIAWVACAGPLAAAQCVDTFGNALGTTGSTLEMRDAAALSNTGNRVLATDDLQIKSGSGHCDGGACSASGTPAASLALPAHGVKTDLDDQSVALAPGDHYFDDVDLRNGNTLTLSGAGQVRIHVADRLRIRDNARVNVNGDPLDLVFLVGDDAEIEDDAQVRAVVYARDRIRLRNRARVDGALVGDQVEIRDQAAVSYASAAALAIDGLCTAGGGPVVLEGALNFKIEVGALNVIDTYAKPEFTRVNFTQEFDEPPLVFTLPTTDGGNSAAHRVRNIDRDGFDIMTLEPDGEDGPHIAMALNYLAVEAGVHDLPGGRKLIAGTLETRKVQAWGGGVSGIGWEKVGFAGQFSQAPAVLGQIQTMHNEQETRIPAKPSKPWLTTAISDVTAGGMRVALERSESLNGSVTQDETVAYFAIEPVSRIRFDDSNGKQVEMEVIRTGELLQGWGTCKQNRVEFSQRWPKTPVVLATKNTRDGDAGIGEGDGGWLRRCSSTTTYTELQVDEVRTKIGDRNRNHATRERAGLVMFSGNFVMQARELDHFRLYHDGQGIAGLAETLKLVACRNADCSELYTDSVTVTFEPADGSTYWSGSGVLGNQVTFTGGSRVVTLNRMAGGKLTLGLTSTPTPQQPLRCFDGAVETCAMTFIATDFVVSTTDQVAAQPALGELSLPTCWSGFQSRKVMLKVAAEYVKPAWKGPAVSVNGVALPVDGQPAAVTFVFDDACRAALQIDYPDVGLIGLDLAFAGSGELEGLSITGYAAQVFYPAALRLQATGASGLALDASAPGAAPIHPAAAPFTLGIAAVNAAGKAVSAYRPEDDDRLAAYAQRLAPAQGFQGVLTLSSTADLITSAAAPGGIDDYLPANIAAAGFVDGAYSHAQARYSEVGAVVLYLADRDYMGHEIVAVPVTVGRFVPASFQALGSIVNRAATAGCAGDGFSYLGETLRIGVQLLALNAAGEVVRNYQGSYAGLDGSGLAGYPGVAGNSLAAVVDGLDLSGRVDLQRIDLAVPWAAGLATLELDLAVRRAAQPDGPFEGLRFGLTLRDPDGVALAGLDTDVSGNGVADHALLGVSNLRAGRLSVGNAHGSELRSLQVPVVMQHFAGPGQGFVTHAADGCTPLAGVQLSDVDSGDGLTVAETCIVDSAAASGASACPPGTAGSDYSATPVAGLYPVVLLAPGSGNAGAVRLTVDAPDWAEFDWSGLGDGDPSGLATFGIYNRDIGVIYQRELR